MAKKTVGQFTSEDWTISGPVTYMKERGAAYLDEIEAGTSLGFNAMIECAPRGADLEMLVLVALQTNYAGWKGAKALMDNLS